MVAALLVVLLFALPDHDSRAAATGSRALAPAQAIVSVPSLAPQRRLPRSFLGLSTEYWTLPLYEQHLTLLERVLSLLRVPDNGPFLLRVGGDSADHSDWVRRERSLPDWEFRLSPAWLAGASRLVEAMRLRLILDLNLLTASPRTAAAWARIARSALPRHAIAAYEIGNEPDIYNRLWWRSLVVRAGFGEPALPRDLTAARYAADFRAYARLLARVAPHVPLAGPALANPGVHADWISRLLAGPHPGLGLVTAHRYPFGACSPVWARNHPTVARILSERATSGVVRSISSAMDLAHRAGLPFRLTEFNSVTCGGLPGVSNAFATALWAPDSLFYLLHAGVDGVNFHVREYAINAPFTLTDRGINARPLLYGMIMFVRALGPGATLLHVRSSTRPGLRLDAWAVRVRGGVHVLMIDRSRRDARVEVRIPGSGLATVQRLLAPSPYSTTGVTLAGQHLTATGAWAGHRIAPQIARSPRGYRVAIPARSAALLSVR